MEKSPVRWWDLPSAIFLFLAILFSAWRLQSTNWTDGLEYAGSVALLGLIVGLALGQSRYQRRGVVLLSIGYMLVVFCWQWLGFMEFTEEETYLGDKLLMLVGRLLLGLSEFASNRPVKDPLFFVALLSIPYWFSGLFSGYQLTRYTNGLAAVLPSGILMFVIYLNHYTTKDYSWLFGAYLFIALLLLGRQKFLTDRKKWREKRVQISVESGTDFNNTILVSAAVLILLVWVVPSTLPLNPQARKAWQRISRNWFSEDERFENMFASVKKDNLPSRDFYRNELPLGTHISQSESVAFLVYAPAAAQDFPRLYWRGRVYDRFEDGRWLTSDVEGKNYEPQDGNFEIPDTENRENLNFTFNVYIKGQAILYTAAQPVWVSHPANIVHTKIPAEEEEEQVMDIVTLQASPYLEAGETYHANALLANPTIPELQEAGQEYPEWITDKYLQLPADFSARIQALALEITAAYDNPYDKAAAITNYLRSEIEYAPSVSFPEGTVDRLEYFLFEGKQGFCNYYASAEVLMLRSVGVPVRLAVGFAQGEPNLQNTFYTVRERDAHAWPEVYFPGYGWIEFEPTGNQDPVERPQEREETLTTDQTNNPLELEALQQEEPQFQIPLERPLAITSRTQIFRISILASGLILAYLALFFKRRYAPNTQTAIILKTLVERSGWETPAWLNKWARWAMITPIERYFHSINASLQWIGKPQPLHITAAERAAILQEVIPSAAAPIATLLHEYQSTLFSPHGGNVQIARRAAWSIVYQTIIMRLT
ncbi:MAG: transglutaminase-like domain-containing protein [Anaerolineales bacterium]|nr:transglutaminase-like domain-containing protein [Anaerolineales bacterium]